MCVWHGYVTYLRVWGIIYFINFREKKMKYIKGLILTTAMSAFASVAYANCPAVTVKNNQGIIGDYTHNNFGLKEFESKANCTLTFKENPNIKALNAKIKGNKALPSVADRLPSEPLVVAPFDAIGTYGGTLQTISNATEAGTSENISHRHVNFVRFSEDLKTVVPHVAKSMSASADYTEFTFKLRKGHKWSDGEPFTSEDVVFWWENLSTDTNVIKKLKSQWKTGDTPMTVTAPDAQTVVFKFAVSKPSFFEVLASTHIQPFQPKHFLGQFHPAINPNANALAKQAGFENGYAVIKFYFGGSDWKDVPSPYLKDPTFAKVNALPGKRAVVPTLESHLIIEDSKDGRRVAANPYFFAVDTQGNQLPYIDEVKEIYLKDNEVTVLKMINKEVDIKHQNLNLSMAPTLLDGAEKGGYRVYFLNFPRFYAFGANLTHKDPEIRAIFSNLAFRKALSLAFNREEINETIFFGQAKITQNTGFKPSEVFVDDSMLTKLTQFDLATAKAEFAKLGLKDMDGDGFYELPSGKALNLTFTYSPQYIPAKMAELLVQNLNDAGFKVNIREITSDEYRNAMSANDSDFIAGPRGQTAYKLNAIDFTAPFSDFFGTPNGMLWATYISTNGADGIKPPQWVYDMKDAYTQFSRYSSTDPEYMTWGKKIAQIQNDNLPYVGLMQVPVPMYVNDRVQNMPHFVLEKGVSPNPARYAVPFGGYQYFLEK